MYTKAFIYVRKGPGLFLDPECQLGEPDRDNELLISRPDMDHFARSPTCTGKFEETY